MILEMRPIPGFDNRYWINEDGSCIDDFKRGKKIFPKHKDNSGYVHVNLSNKNYRRGNRTYRVHQLVAAAFIGKKPNGCVIDHIDRNKINNHFSNLRYVSQSVNGRNSARHGHIAVSLLSENENQNFKTLSDAGTFLSKKLEKSLRYCQGKLSARYNEICGFKVIYADDIPALCPRNNQKVIQLSLF